MRFLWFS